MAAISSHKMSSLVRRSGYHLVLIIVGECATKATSRRDFILVQGLNYRPSWQETEGGRGMLQWFITSWQSKKQKWSMKQG